MDYEKLRVLNQLKDEGSISEEEYQRQREKLSRESELSSKSEFDDLRKLTEDEKTYAFFMHLSQFATFILPLIGLLAPMIMWIMKREDPYIDAHGKVIFNWLLSITIYTSVLLVLAVFTLGLTFIPIVILGLLSIIFVILGAKNAKEGIIKDYPLAIRFMK
ncbi:MULTISPECIES: DUF4870 domain-containing protein [Idiomarina]|jgi:uncharacterized Tic20 family protein|uniref:DUF4870 domain-containing protein n=2 Tax=Idiomarina baltica TaxID=190892 RepID=A0A348WLH8_9GAMM|nr:MULTISPECIES: DUF4870 domain-containing protein [Idiomarina]MAF75471.1 hypothetical protein [Idiomarinaceae bacterium]MEC8926508.1 DUF4870 domain-containing protein [Pseudomonadota bacterium]EAQ33233.1 hypothetical protein OS145_02655 [Idiomarina baltica OS145]MBR38298.1 hypothetical protein [Idiomarina sp.]HAE90593.1 DUF4870 domain-containing protein [Idiomarina sp.]|tara:strand:- start:1610 stop:2092 length:483 start_codon:yes stop_codon:yes gene_type:complete